MKAYMEEKELVEERGRGAWKVRKRRRKTKRRESVEGRNKNKCDGDRSNDRE